MRLTLGHGGVITLMPQGLTAMCSLATGTFFIKCFQAMAVYHFLLLEQHLPSSAGVGSACQSERAKLHFQSHHSFSLFFSVQQYEELVFWKTYDVPSHSLPRFKEIR